MIKFYSVAQYYTKLEMPTLEKKTILRENKTAGIS